MGGFTKLWDYASGHSQHVSHFGVAKSGPTIPVLKGNFAGTSLDPVLWTSTFANGGNVAVQQGYAAVNTSADAAGSVILRSVGKGRFEAGQVTVWQSGVYAGDGVANNVRRWGLGNAAGTEGLYFKWNGTAFQVVAKKNNVETVVEQADFSDETSWVPTAANNTFRIEYSAGRALFYRARAGHKVLLHEMVRSDEPLVNDLDLGMFYENTNTGNTSDVTMRLRGASISVWGDLRSFNEGGALITEDFRRSVARGIVSGHEIKTMFGYNDDIDSGPEDVWSAGGDYTGQPVGGDAEEIEVFSSDAADTSAGTGARTVRIRGLDANWMYQEADVTLSGVTPVATTGITWRRCWDCEVLTGGSSGENEGTLTGRHVTTTANVFFVMSIGRNRTNVGAFTVPADSTAYMVRNKFHMVRANGSAGSCQYSVRQRTPGGVFVAHRYESASSSQPDDYEFIGSSPALPAMTDVKVRVETVSDANTRVSASVEYLLINEG